MLHNYRQWHPDMVPEWLRGTPAKCIGSASAGSNPVHVGIFFVSPSQEQSYCGLLSSTTLSNNLAPCIDIVLGYAKRFCQDLVDFPLPFCSAPPHSVASGAMHRVPTHQNVSAKILWLFTSASLASHRATSTATSITNQHGIWSVARCTEPRAASVVRLLGRLEWWPRHGTLTALPAHSGTSCGDGCYNEAHALWPCLYCNSLLSHIAHTALQLAL